MQRTAHHLPLVLVDLLDEDLDGLADALLGALGDEFLDERREAGHALGHVVLGHLLGVALRLGAVLVGVAEHPHDVEARGNEEGLELVEVRLGLAREADDDIAADSGLRDARAHLVEELQERLSAAEAPHPPQQRR